MFKRAGRNDVGEVCCDDDSGGDKAGVRLGANTGSGAGIEESRFDVCEGFQDSFD